MELIDAHCHLQDNRLSETIGDVLTDAQSHGVRHFVVNGCCQDDWERVISLSVKYPGVVIPQLGLHPWWVGGRRPDWLGSLRCLLEANPHAGVGECGLDKGSKAPQGVDFQEQMEVFESQLRLAEDLRRPVSVHCVRAFGAVHDMLRRTNITVPVVLHAWTGSAEITATLAQFPNVYFSLNGNITKLAPNKAFATMRTVPADRCLLESDSPDGLIHIDEAWMEALPELKKVAKAVKEAAKRTNGLNTPRTVLCVLALVALALGKDKEDLGQVCCRNTRRVFFDSVCCKNG